MITKQLRQQAVFGKSHRWFNIALTAVMLVLFLWPANPAYAGTNVWTTHGPADDYVQALAIAPSSPNIVYAGVDYEGVSKSVDNGFTWSTPVAPGTLGGPMSALAVDPGNPDIIYAGAFATGAVYKSTDGGETWPGPGSALLTMDVSSIIIAPSNHNTVYVSDGMGMHVTTDGGDHWSLVGTTGLPSDYGNTILAVDPANSSIIYAGMYGGLYKSVNGGGIWNDFSSGLPSDKTVGELVIDPSHPGNLYAITGGDGLYQSLGGGNWTSIKGDLTSTEVSSLVVDPAHVGTFYVGTNDAGVFETTTGGTNWSPMNNGLTTTNVWKLVYDPTAPETLYAGTDKGVFDIELGAYAVPALTGLNPSSAQAGASAFTLTVNGSNFSTVSVVRWNGTDLVTSFVRATQLTAAVPGTDITTVGVGYVSVFNPTPGGGVSNEAAFYTTQTGANVTASDTASGTNPSVEVGGSSGINATASGTGTLSVATYDSNPGGATGFQTGGAYMDVHIGSGSIFTSLTVNYCGLAAGDKVYWWNGSAWALASNQAFNPSTGCVTVTINASTSPSLGDLTGTPLVASGPNKLYLPLVFR